jgi:hypothetical protein
VPQRDMPCRPRIHGRTRCRAGSARRAICGFKALKCRRDVMARQKIGHLVHCLSAFMVLASIVTSIGCGQSAPAEPAAPPEPRDRFPRAMLGRWTISDSWSYSVSPRGLTLEGANGDGAQLSGLTVTCSGPDSCEFRSSNTGTAPTGYCRGTATLVDSSLVVESDGDAAANQANASSGQPAARDVAICAVFTRTGTRSNSAAESTESPGSGSGGEACQRRCAAAQAACVLRCGDDQACVRECGATSMECVGGC